MELGFDFDYVSRPMRGEAARAVEQVWCARGTVPYRSERIAPTGSTVVVLVLGDPITETASTGASLTTDRGFVIGPHTAPVENAPEGETYAVGIVTTAVGCEAVLGCRPAGLRGRVEPLEAAGTALAALRDEVGGLAHRGASAGELLDVVDRFVTASVDLGVPGLARVERAVAALVAEPRRPISDVAGELGVSHAHLDREFARVVGLRPRELARLLHLRELIECLDPLGQVSWADVAAAGGWSDQAHLSRDFKRHTGLSPSRYLETQRAFAEAGNPGPGFSPDLTQPR
ncbi:AraC family transcriptional regulator [Demequina sp. NBRC 110056]|uniref:helix-turn-helix domain-containing protein n=1 Tax=Demequina sp. NBRC 110056 TaxID=1570345 RepID=UPI0009FC0510|nr:AraC family transcriptional regulator [Demequina sp. NBRC 110056]